MKALQKKVSVSASAWAWLKGSKEPVARSTSSRSATAKARSSSLPIGCTSPLWDSTNLPALKSLVTRRLPILKIFSSAAVSVPSRALADQ